MQKYGKYLLYGLGAIFVTLFVAWEIAMTKTTELFNAAMERQQIFKGKIAAEALSCDFTGKIKFKNLQWSADTGETIVNVPTGYIQLELDKLLSRKVGPEAIRTVYIEDAGFRLLFTEDMKLDILRQEAEEEAKKEAKKEAEQKDADKDKPQDPKAEGTKPKHIIPQAEHNLNLPEKVPNWKFVLKNCSVSAYIQNRVYAMTKVNCSLAVKQHQFVELDFSGGPLGGTMDGELLALRGKSDLKADKNDYELTIKEVVPQSLGLGKLSDPVTIKAHVHGTSKEPIAEGTIAFKTLDLHTMVFTNVDSEFRYANNYVHFNNTTGNCWGGFVRAKGLYNINNRRYRIEGTGQDIDVAQAIKRADAEGRGNLSFLLLCDPRHKQQAITGHVEIGKGKINKLHFHSLTADVFAHNKLTYIKNINLHTGLLSVKKHAIKTGGGKVELKPVLPNEEAILAELGNI